MTNHSEWQEANRRLMAEQREKLGDPPTAEEMMSYSRGELSESEEERIRDLLVAYPELARMYGAPFPEEPEENVADEAIEAGFQDLQRRLGGAQDLGLMRRKPVRHYIPTTIAAALALLFFGLYVQAENRARDNARDRVPYLLGAPQDLDSDRNRGPAAPTVLRKDGDAYLLRPHLINQIRFPHYNIELHDQNGAVWTSPYGEPDEDDAFLIVIPHGFLRAGVTYQLHIFGVDGQTRRPIGSYNVAAQSE